MTAAWFSDTFVDTSTTALTAHTPTGTPGGTSWTLLNESASVTLVAINASDRAAATATDGNEAIWYYPTSENPADADQQVDLDVEEWGGAVSADDICGVLLRATKEDQIAVTADRYGLSIMCEIFTGGNDLSFGKLVDGVWTNDIAVYNGIARTAGDILHVAMLGTAYTVWINSDAAVISGTDSSITAAGTCGLSWGWASRNTGFADDISTTFSFNSVVFYSGLAPVYVQDKFRFRNDDGAVTEIA